MKDMAERRVIGSVIDRLVRIRRLPMSLEFRPAGAHAMAHGWPELRPGAPAPDLRFPETWQNRFMFQSDDGTTGRPLQGQQCRVSGKEVDDWSSGRDRFDQSPGMRQHKTLVVAGRKAAGPTVENLYRLTTVSELGQQADGDGQRQRRCHRQ